MKAYERSSKDLRSAAQHIYNTYLAVNAPLEVNISRDIVKPIEIGLNDKEFKFTNNLFKDVLVNVCMNLSDTASRFRKSVQYKNYLKNKTVVKKLERNVQTF